MKGKPFAKVVDILKSVAPTAAAALGGPMAPLAVGVIRKILGAGDDVDLEEALLTAAADPASVVRLKEIEAAMIAQEGELGVKFEDIAARDRADARARQVALKDNTPAHVLYLTTAGFFGSLGYMLVYGLPESGGEPLLLMLGSLATAWGASITYFVGSSAGSKAKTDLLSKEGR